MKEKIKNSKGYYILLQPIMQILDQTYQHNEDSVPKEKLKIYATFIDRYNNFIKDNIIPKKTYSKTEFNTMELFYINILKHLEKNQKDRFLQYLPKMFDLQQACVTVDDIPSTEKTSISNLTLDPTFAKKVNGHHDDVNLYSNLILLHPDKNNIIMEVDNNIKNTLKERLDELKSNLAVIFKSSMIDLYLYSIIHELKNKKILSPAVEHEIDKQFEMVLSTEDQEPKKDHIIKLHDFIKNSLQDKDHTVLSKTVHDVLKTMQSVIRTIKGSNKIAGKKTQYINRQNTIH